MTILCMIINSSCKISDLKAEINKQEIIGKETKIYIT